MVLFNFVIPYAAMMFNLYAFLKAYSATIYEKPKIKITFVNIIIFLIAALIIYISNNFSNVTIKVITSLSVLIIVYKIVFNEKFSFLIFKTFIIYLILIICDFLSSTVFLFFPMNSVGDLGKLSILRVLCTILDSLLLMLVFLIKRFVNFLNKFLDYVVNNLNIVIFSLIISFLGLFSFLIISFGKYFDLKVYAISILIMALFLFLCFVMIYQYFKNKQSEEEQHILLDLMNEYEKILENDRVNRHEMLNNLIILKSFKNKDTKEYEETLNDIIKEYQMKKTKFFTKLYSLPSGIKGIIYYKISNIKNLDIDLNLLIAKNVNDVFESLNTKIYFKICKIIGIVLDNAIEASSKTKDKLVLIDIYLENKDLIIYIENSFSNNVELSEINKKGISSKGKNRGYGLFILNKILDETDLLEFNQNIKDNRFISILKIKNPS